jgi:D-alanyl-D-alanine dipeptidase
MGGEIDAIGAISEPDHYAQFAQDEPQGEAATWHHRRRLLAAAMASAGFAQHPHEWWHFSWGDQLWAWRTGQPLARYGSAS